MPDHSNTNPPLPKSSDRSLLADFLKFLGLMLTIGGSLAILRTHGVENRWFSGPQLFFTLLIPVGLCMWAAGFFLRKPQMPRGDDSHG
jgi:hypothetical protein